MEKSTPILTLTALGKFAYIIFRDFFHGLPEKKKTGDTDRKKLNDPRLKKLTIEKKAGLVLSLKELCDLVRMAKRLEKKWKKD